MLQSSSFLLLVNWNAACLSDNQIIWLSVFRFVFQHPLENAIRAAAASTTIRCCYFISVKSSWLAFLASILSSKTRNSETWDNNLGPFFSGDVCPMFIIWTLQGKIVACVFFYWIVHNIMPQVYWLVQWLVKASFHVQIIFNIDNMSSLTWHLFTRVEWLISEISQGRFCPTKLLKTCESLQDCYLVQFSLLHLSAS